MTTPRPIDFEAIDPAQRDIAVRVGRAWRDLRRGASTSQLIDYLFGSGEEALEVGQMDTLDLLVQQSLWRMGDLADALRVDPSTATRAVQRLERFGLASRCTSPSDKRVVMVSITEDGILRHSEAARRRQEVIMHMLAVFDLEEFEQLASYLERFVGALDEFVAEVSESTKNG